LIERQRGAARYVQFGLFQQFPDLVHGSFTRSGGRSAPPFEGLNVSVGVGDEAENVIYNRLQALRSLELDEYRCATAWMIHSADVLILDGEEWDDWRDDRSDWPHRSYIVDGQELVWTMRPRRKADAVLTKKRGVALAMSSADCVPLMLYDPLQQAIGLVHAGWRGTARGVAAAAVTAMREQFGCQPGQIYAGIGPSIGPCCYEVGETVRSLFRGDERFEIMPTAERYRNLVRASAVFTVRPCVERAGQVERERDEAGESLRLDLWETNRRQLLLAGLLPERIEVAAICTCCEKARFFSYRGEHGKTGRFPSLLALRP
jgi:purine-nucleoside/S-methyl-5'-thioadenosine phosphorylase / adenosine deaminase